MGKGTSKNNLKKKKKTKAGKRKKKTKVVKNKSLELVPKTKPLTTDIAVLEEAFGGDKKMVLFFLAWLKNNRNATKAYQEIHPDVSYGVAATLGSRMLKKVDITLVLDSYGIGIEDYFNQLKEGLSSVKYVGLAAIPVPDQKTRRIYHQALGKMLGFETPDIQINNANINQNNNQNLIENIDDEELDDLIS